MYFGKVGSGTIWKMLRRLEGRLTPNVGEALGDDLPCERWLRKRRLWKLRNKEIPMTNACFRGWIEVLLQKEVSMRGKSNPVGRSISVVVYRRLGILFSDPSVNLLVGAERLFGCIVLHTLCVSLWRTSEASFSPRWFLLTGVIIGRSSFLLWRMP